MKMSNNSIEENTTRQSNFNSYPKLLFYLIGLIFILSLLDSVFSNLRYIQYFITILISILFWRHFLKYKTVSKIFIFLSIVFTLLVVRGISLGNYMPYLLNDIYLWSFCIFINFFGSKSFLVYYRIKIPELFAKLLYISIPIAIIIFIRYGSIGDVVFDRDIINEDISVKALYYPVQLSPLLIPFIFDFKKSLSFIVILGNLLFIILGVLSATRIPIIVGIFAFFTLTFQLKQIKPVKIFKTLISILIVIAVVYIFSPVKIASFFNDKIDFVVSRFVIDDHISNGRDSEVKDLFAEFRWDEFLLGRGAGGSQVFGFWKTIGTEGNLGIPFTHYGFLNLILKGGFPLLIIVYGLAFWSMFNLWRSGDRKYFFVILLYLIYEISFTKFNDPFYLIFLWISISYSLKLNQAKIKNISTTANSFLK